MSGAYIKGLDLSELFYREAAKPILAKRFPDLIHSAALIGRGSEVLALPEHLGSVDQFVDSTDALDDPERFGAVWG